MAGFRELARDHAGLARIVDGLAKEHAQTRGMTAAILQMLQRGLWGRLRWMLLGE